jgi:hypothetical protein
VSKNSVERAIVEMKEKAVELGILEKDLRNYETVKLHDQINRTLLNLLKVSQVSPVMEKGRGTISKKESRGIAYALWVRIDETLPWIELKGSYETSAKARQAAEIFLRTLQVNVISMPLKGGKYEREKLVKIAPQTRKSNHNLKL